MRIEWGEEPEVVRPRVFVCRVEPVTAPDGEPLSGPLEEVQHGARAPVPAVLDVDYRTGYRYRVKFDRGPDGAYGLRALTVTAAASAGDVTGNVLRSVRVAELEAHVFEYLRGAVVDYRTLGRLAPQDVTRYAPGVADELFRGVLRDVPWQADPFTLAGPMHEADRKRLRKLGPSDTLTASTVAELYRFAEAHGRPPVDFLVSKLELPKRTAMHWVKIARERGALEPSRRRPRAVAVEREADRGDG